MLWERLWGRDWTLPFAAVSLVLPGTAACGVFA